MFRCLKLFSTLLITIKVLTSQKKMIPAGKPSRKNFKRLKTKLYITKEISRISDETTATEAYWKKTLKGNIKHHELVSVL